MITFFPLRNISICDFYFAEGWSLTARTTFRWGVWLYCFCRKQQDRASQLQASSLRTWSVGSTQGKCTNSGFNKMWWQCVCVCVCVIKVLIHEMSSKAATDFPPLPDICSTSWAFLLVWLYSLRWCMCHHQQDTLMSLLLLKCFPPVCGWAVEKWKCFCGYLGANWLNYIMPLSISIKCSTICILHSWKEIYGHAACSRKIFLSYLPVFRSHVFPAWERPISCKHSGHFSEL